MGGWPYKPGLGKGLPAPAHTCQRKCQSEFVNKSYVSVGLSHWVICPHFEYKFLGIPEPGPCFTKPQIVLAGPS